MQPTVTQVGFGPALVGQFGMGPLIQTAIDCGNQRAARALNFSSSERMTRNAAGGDIHGFLQSDGSPNSDTRFAPCASVHTVILVSFRSSPGIPYSAEKE